MKDLGEILRYFLRLGCLGFGGPVAMVAMIQGDLVEDRKWIELEELEQAKYYVKCFPG